MRFLDSFWGLRSHSARGLLPGGAVAGFILLTNACGSSSGPDGSGGSTASGGRDEEAEGGQGGAGDVPSGDGDTSSPSGGKSGQEPTTGDTEDPEASGGQGNVPPPPPPPRWVAFSVTGAGPGHYPLILARTDGALEPVVVTESLRPPIPHYSFNPDGSELLFVEADSGAYVVPLDDDGVGERERIHEELTDGTSVRYAGFSPHGEVMVAQFVDAGLQGHYAFRGVSGDPTFQPLTLDVAWDSSHLGPIWSSDGQFLIIVEGAPLGNVAETVSLIDFSHFPDAPEVHTLLEDADHVQPLTGATWSADSRFVVLSGNDALYLLDTQSAELEFLPLSRGVTGGQGMGGASSGEDPEVPEFGGYLPQFSPNSRRLAWITFQDAPWTGPSNLWAVSLDDETLLGDEPLSQQKQLVYAGDNTTHAVQANYVSWASDSKTISFGADVSVDGRVDMYRAMVEGDANSWDVEPIAFLQEGETFNGHAMLPDGVVILTGQEYTPNGLYFTAFADEPTERTTLFEFGQDAYPGWAEFAGLSVRGDRGAFFYSYEFDAEAYGNKQAQLLHIKPDGEPRLLIGPLESEGYFGTPGEFSPNEHWFIFNADVNGDFYREVMVTEADGDSYREPQIIASLSDAEGATAQGFVWQP